MCYEILIWKIIDLFLQLQFSLCVSALHTSDSFLLYTYTIVQDVQAFVICPSRKSASGSNIDPSFMLRISLMRLKFDM